MLEKGSIVEVFEDPITKKVKEGNAKVLYCIEEPGADGLGLYAVNFFGDHPSMVVARMINERALVEAVSQ